MDPFPTSVQRFIVLCARSYPAIQKVFLFGSRARGDATERSDFDLAIEAPGITHAQWSRFALEVKECLPSLCSIDLLLLNDRTSPELRQRVKEEGIVFYDQAA